MRRFTTVLLCLLLLARGWAGGGMVVQAATLAPAPGAFHATATHAEKLPGSAQAQGTIQVVHPPGCPGTAAASPEPGAAPPGPHAPMDDTSPSHAGCLLCAICHGPALDAARPLALASGPTAAKPDAAGPDLVSADLPRATEPPAF